MSKLADEFNNCSDRYEILNSLGKNVWLINLSTYNKMAVLKQVENAEVYNKIKELGITGVPKILSIFKQDSRDFIIEEYIGGDTLADILKSQGKLSAKQVKHIVIQICNILIPLHKANIIHRDIKPSNIILTPTNDIFIIDFGIARSFNNSNNADTKRLGTEFYASPEQYGFKQTDIRSDIYSVGKLMVVLLSGRESLDKVKKLPYSNIIKKCIKVDADDRYKNAVALKNAFNKIYLVVAIMAITAVMAAVLTINHICADKNDFPKENIINLPTESTTAVEETQSILMEESVEITTEMPIQQVTETTISTTTVELQTKPAEQTTQAPPPLIKKQESISEVTTAATAANDGGQKPVGKDNEGYAHNYGYFGTSTRFGTLFTRMDEGYGTYILECRDENVSKQKADFYVYKDNSRIETLVVDTAENGINLSLCGEDIFIPKTENAEYIKTQYVPESTFYEIMYCDLDYDGIFDMLAVEMGVYDILDAKPLYAVIHPIKVNEDVQMTLCKGDKIALYDTEQSAEVLANRIITYNYRTEDDTAIIEYHTFVVEDGKVIQMPDMAQTPNLLY